MSDYGVKVSAEDQDVYSAIGQEILLTTRYPFAKLDTTKDESFKNTLLTFITNPTEPSGVGDTELTTTVYSFPHGYDYIPSAWHLVQITNPAGGTAFDQDYFQDSGIVASHTAFDGAIFESEVDATTVYYKITKYYDSGLGGSTNDITGLQLKIRSYIFVEGVV